MGTAPILNNNNKNKIKLLIKRFNKKINNFNNNYKKIIKILIKNLLLTTNILIKIIISEVAEVGGLILLVIPILLQQKINNNYFKIKIKIK